MLGAGHGHRVAVPGLAVSDQGDDAVRSTRLVTVSTLDGPRSPPDGLEKGAREPDHVVVRQGRGGLPRRRQAREAPADDGRLGDLLLQAAGREDGQSGADKGWAESPIASVIVNGF